jgi:hypothetical protein
MVVGNEGFDYIRATPAEVTPVLCQSLSLPGQDRSRASLAAALREAGVRAGARHGIVGWKYFGPNELSRGDYLVVPAFLVAALAAAAEPDSRLDDVTQLFLNPIKGLRVRAEAATIAELEYGAALVTEHVRRVVDGVEPGMIEIEALRLFGLDYYPSTCHPMVTSGRRDFIGLCSPTGKTLALATCYRSPSAYGAA